MADQEAPDADALKARIIRAKLAGDAAPPPTETGGGAFFGAAKLLPEGVQKFLPDFLSGPSVGEQLTAAGERTEAAEKAAGRPLTLKERLAAEPATSSPVAMGFGTHQLGGDVPVPKIGTAGRAEYTRAAKPSVGSLRAAGGREPYYAKTEDAVQSIVENRSNLRYADADGNVISGELPKSLDQFTDAIDQTKQEIFKKYDALAKEAGMFGPPVDLRPVVQELNNITNDHVITDFHPEIADYAQKQASTLLARGVYWSEDAQRAVQLLNSSLKAFYRNPDYNTASRAYVDSLTAKALRSELDNTIEKSVGPGYQDLKNQYGSLKAIETDVRNRAGVVARQEKGGGIFGRLADVASADQVLRGFLTMRPEAIAHGAFMQVFKRFIKMQRDPNKAVTDLFRRASTPVVSPSPASPFAAVNPLSPQPDQQ
jgi:hypothetical protein